MVFSLWEHRDSNPGPSACKADALNQLSYTPEFLLTSATRCSPIASAKIGKISVPPNFQRLFLPISSLFLFWAPVQERFPGKDPFGHETHNILHIRTLQQTHTRPANRSRTFPSFSKKSQASEGVPYAPPPARDVGPQKRTRPPFPRTTAQTKTARARKKRHTAEAHRKATCTRTRIRHTANVARADDGCDTKRGCPITRAPSYLFPEPERYSARCGLMPRASSSSCAAEMVEGESIITSRPELFLGNAM